MIRILKCLLVLTVGLNGLFCALQNVANFRQAKDALAYVISGSTAMTRRARTRCVSPV